MIGLQNKLYQTHHGAIKMSFCQPGNLLPCLRLCQIAGIPIQATNLVDLERGV
jgi:hypothetical protein